MSRRILLTAAAIFHGALGLAALSVPMLTVAAFGSPLEPGAEPIVRLLGATLVGLAAGFWLVRNAAYDAEVRALLVAGLVINALSVMVVAFAIVGGQMEARTWITAAVRLLFAAGFAYHLLAARRPASA
ncbi:MAG: hypothetical protein HY834_01855 [Devosia nanyangense]|uniref:Uncharacterized protein n=1 Tax=Devosia nanyangense TaxID=1228055 RepID=A0A933NWZ0_9HYPH|nr:hypothetical protein [Devosia nanyangense]